MKKRILVVDDSPVVRAMMEDFLDDLNYEVSTAADGLEACRKVGENTYSLIITDLNMPGMDGIMFAQQAKQMPNCRFVPIVMLSSETDGTRITEAKKLGISTFLPKPVRENQLKSILQITLGA